MIDIKVSISIAHAKKKTNSQEIKSTKAFTKLILSRFKIIISLDFVGWSTAIDANYNNFLVYFVMTDFLNASRVKCAKIIS